MARRRASLGNFFSVAATRAGSKIVSFGVNIGQNRPRLRPQDRTDGREKSKGTGQDGIARTDFGSGEREP